MSLPSAFLPIFARQLDPAEILVGLVSSSWFIHIRSRGASLFRSKHYLRVDIGLGALGAWNRILLYVQLDHDF
jgi:hypothetical protein